VVEGETQRAAVAPFAGYIRSAPVRAGDTVKAGQLLARLDDRDLQLERVRWESDLEVSLRKEREAMAAADRVAMRLAAAQAGQAKAQLDLVNAKLQRIDITAPFDAVVVQGDLSQMQGSPVESGKLLFELAPLEAWRVILKVDERDVAWLHAGQRGELVLASLPGRSFELTTQRVLSVAVAEEGRNYFRVEAGLDKDAARLRPGMEGVAKLTVGEASLLWVWTHRMTEWVRRTAWEWAP
jgi:RND family efflux transporter MFP subunit